MKIYLMIFFVLLGAVQTNAQCSGEEKSKLKKEKTMAAEKVDFKNLPDNARLDDEFRINKYDEQGMVISFEIITIEERLNQIGAKYDGDKLVDSDGQEIRFYKKPVRGASQGFEEDRKQRERDEKELDELKKRFRVIEIYVNPLKVM
jgi:hypothetical protein